jgi:general secretion pathway protein H
MNPKFAAPFALRKLGGVRQGITLIEIIVVVSIIGVLMGVVASSLSNFLGPGQKEATSEITRKLNEAYSKALIQHTTIIFELDLDKQSIRLLKLERDESGLEEKPLGKAFIIPSSAKIFAGVDLSGQKISEGKIRIPFLFDGTSSDYTFLIGKEGDVRRSIQLYRYGGKVRIVPGEEIRMAEKTLQKIDYGVDLREEMDSQKDMNRY